MVGVLALEAELADVVVIGEDLGTVEPSARRYLEQKGVLGTSILWFEMAEDEPLDPSQYRELCMASVNTHDLPPTAGYLEGVQLELREDLGLLARSPEEERRQARQQLETFFTAVEAGATAVKVFPAGALGGSEQRRGQDRGALPLPGASAVHAVQRVPGGRGGGAADPEPAGHQ